MKKFTKIKEEFDSIKYYKVQSEVELIIEATTEGDAGYIADSILGSINNINSDFSISNIIEISKEEYDNLTLNESSVSKELSAEQRILDLWFERFDKRIATETEKFEFYHDMRNLKYDGDLVFEIIKGK
jgi:hypothetical protein